MRDGRLDINSLVALDALAACVFQIVAGHREVYERRLYGGDTKLFVAVQDSHLDIDPLVDHNTLIAFVSQVVSNPHQVQGKHLFGEQTADALLMRDGRLEVDARIAADAFTVQVS